MPIYADYTHQRKYTHTLMQENAKTEDSSAM